MLELKSTFVRRSVKEAWTHRTSTLRQAGLQLHRKVEAVRRALAGSGPLKRDLGLEASCEPVLTAWIIDTSIECDHQRFRGFLKVSLEEVRIALRDDRHWLRDQEGLFQTKKDRGEPSGPDVRAAARGSLYPDGFSAGHFIGVLESSAVWAVAPWADERVHQRPAEAR